MGGSRKKEPFRIRKITVIPDGALINGESKILQLSVHYEGMIISRTRYCPSTACTIPPVCLIEMGFVCAQAWHMYMHAFQTSP